MVQVKPWKAGRSGRIFDTKCVIAPLRRRGRCGTCWYGWLNSSSSSAGGGFTLSRHNARSANRWFGSMLIKQAVGMCSRTRVHCTRGLGFPSTMPPIANAQAQGAQSYSTRARTNINTSSCPVLCLKNSGTAGVLNGSGRRDISVGSASGKSERANRRTIHLTLWLNTLAPQITRAQITTKKPSAMMASMSSSLFCISKVLAVHAVPKSGEHATAAYTTRLCKRRKKREDWVLDFRGFDRVSGSGRAARSGAGAVRAPD